MIPRELAKIDCEVVPIDLALSLPKSVTGTWMGTELASVHQIFPTKNQAMASWNFGSKIDISIDNFFSDFTESYLQKLIDFKLN